VLIVSPPPPGIPKGAKAPWFEGAAERGEGMARAFKEVADELDCAFFEAGRVIAVSPIDGVHLDAAQHRELGEALVQPVAGLLD
jgi:lysophospholipase L1-like esterase